MSLQFNSISLILVILILLGIFSHNNSITISAGVLLFVQQTFFIRYIAFFETYSLSVGIIFLTIGALSSIVSGKVKIPSLTVFIDWKMFLAIVIGILVAWLAGKGINFMTNNPVLLVGLLVGTICGVAFFGGIPVGPLIAAGILSLLIGRF